MMDWSENRSGGTVTGLVVGLRGYLFNHLSAHIGESVLKFNFSGYGDSILGYLGSTIFLVNNYVAAFRSESDLHRVGQSICTL